ncbi:MAG: hypothetical protein WB729_14700 [Candidatus Sulfotelmatobacter sp.]
MNTRQTKTFIGAMTLAAAGSATFAGLASHTLHPYYALGLLALAAATSRMKVKLPGLEGNMSVNLPFLLAAVVNLSAVEAVLIACVSTMVQCWPKRGMKLKAQQMVFNVSMMAYASSVAGLLFHSLQGVAWAPAQLAIAMAAGTMFLGQTVPVAAIIALNDQGDVVSVWKNLAHLSFPYFVISAGMAAMMQTVDHHLGWGAALAVFPVMYGVHRSYVTYFARAVEAFSTVPLTRAAAAGV